MAQPPFPAVAGPDGLKLAALLASRLCHDFAGGLGTVRNSLQFAREAPDDAREALDLAEEAADEVVQRLRLMRAAWGDGNEAASLADLLKLAANLGRGRIEVRLSGIDPQTLLPANVARLVLNMLLLAAESLPRGGIIAMEGDERNDLLVAIAGHGAAWPAGFAAWLAAPKAAWDYLSREDDSDDRGLQGALTALIAHDGGMAVSMLMSGRAEAAAPLLLRLSGSAC